MNSDQLQRQVADLHRALHATEQALSDERARTARLEPMATAGHAYCAGLLHAGFPVNEIPCILLAAHDATTPSPTQRFVVVAKAVEAWKDRVVALAEVVAQEHGYYSDARAQLRDLIANPPKET